MFVDRHGYESISPAFLQLSFLPQAPAHPGQLSRAYVVLAAMGLPTWFFGADRSPVSVELRKNHTQLAYRLKDKHKEDLLQVLHQYLSGMQTQHQVCVGRVPKLIDSTVDFDRVGVSENWGLLGRYK